MKQLLTAVLTALLLGALSLSASVADTPLTGDRVFEITKQLYDRFDVLPKASAKDKVTFSVMFDGTVILQGRASEPEFSKAAEEAARKVAGVKHVVNSIKVARVPSP